MLRLVPRHLVDALSLCHSWRCHIMVLKMSLIVAELLEPLDGVITGVVIGRDLGEKDSQGNPRGVDAFSPAMVAKSAHLLDECPREDLEEREPLLLGELVAQGIELKAWGCGSSLSHDDLLGW